MPSFFVAKYHACEGYDESNGNAKPRELAKTPALCYLVPCYPHLSDCGLLHGPGLSDCSCLSFLFLSLSLVRSLALLRSELSNLIASALWIRRRVENVANGRWERIRTVEVCLNALR